MKKILIVIFSVLFVNIFLNNLAAADPLKAHILISNKPDGHKSPNNHVQEFALNETVYCAFAASGLVKNEYGIVNAYTNIEVITPSKEVLFAKNRYANISKHIPSDQNSAIFSPLLDITFEQGDSLGMYILKSKVTDINSNVTTITEKTILLFESQSSKKLIMSPVKDAKHLDLLWAHYFKTKNPWAVKSIIKAIRLRDSKNLEKAVVGSAAIWSLESNAFQHHDVYTICQTALKQTKGNIHKHLKQLLINVNEKKDKTPNH
jgi:hypothetical protein